MLALARSHWFPWLIGLILAVAGLVTGRSLLGDFLFLYGLLVLMDSHAWFDAALCTAYFYEGGEAGLDWWKIAEEAYDPPSFYLRFVASAGLSAFAGIAAEIDHPLMWGGCFLLLIAYAITLFLVFRRHIMDHMRQAGIPLKMGARAEEARFDTRNPEDR